MSRVVIIGMGDTGVLTASRLRDVDVIGIAASPGLVSGQELGLRITRPALWARDYLIGYDRFKALDNVELVYGEATGLDPSRRELHVGERIVGYDVLVIASGTANGFWRQPTNKSLAEIETELAQTQQRLAGAGHVAVIGGGASAVSAAARLVSGTTIMLSPRRVSQTSSTPASERTSRSREVSSEMICQVSHSVTTSGRAERGRRTRNTDATPNPKRSATGRNLRRRPAGRC